METLIKKNTGPCTLCPRSCGARRGNAERGFCGAADAVRVGRAALHFWEEPCISGSAGSGAIFFAGCTLRCVYCQNGALLEPGAGVPVSPARLAEIMLSLQRQGAANINFVTPDHYLPEILVSVGLAKAQGLTVPLLFNLSGYETKKMIRMLEGAADIYLADMKYLDPDVSARYSGAPDYPETAKAAIREMVRQQPEPVFGVDGMMKKGVIVRHLLLPGQVRSGREVLRYLHETYGDSIYISILNQYTPPPGTGTKHPELARRVTAREYGRLVDHAVSIGIRNAFIQEGSAASESFIPAFDGTGVYVN